MNSNNCKKEPSQVDIRCSSACSRAAVTALLLSAIAISIIQPINEMKALTALREYISLRDMLKIEIEELQTDPCFIALNNNIGKEKIKKFSLSKLFDYECSSSDLSGMIDDNSKLGPKKMEAALAPKISSAEVSKNSRPAIPAPPTDFSASVIYQIPKIVEVSEIIYELGNHEVIKLARSTSYKFNRDIYQWEVMRERMLINNMRLIPAGQGAFIVPDNQKSVELQTEDRTRFNKEALMKYLNLNDVIQLAEYKLPDSNDLQALLRDRVSFKLPSLDQPIDLKFAIIFIEIGLALSVFYFWMYQREAQRSDSYPAIGTLFGVLSRSILTRLLFLLLTIVPPIASILLAIYSWSVSYFSITIAILVSVCSISIAFDSKMYKKILT